MDTEEQDAVKTPAVEILRLLREIHAAVCGEGESAPPPAKPKQKRNVVPDHVLRLMVEDRPYSPLEIYEKLVTEGLKFGKSSITTTMTKLWKGGKIIRLQKSLFKPVIQPKEGE